MESDFGCIVMFPAIVAVVVFVLLTVAAERKKYAAARKEFEATLQAHQEKYETALQVLRENPTDPEAREAALQSGRELMALARSGEELAHFDEVALTRDILLAATAPVAEIASPAGKQSTESAEDRLRQLESLKEKGLITDDEYQETRQQILSEL